MITRIPTAALAACLALIVLACNSAEDSKSVESVAESAFTFESQDAETVCVINPPNYSDYLAETVFDGVTVAPDVDSREDSEVVALGLAGAEGEPPNFAGYLTIVSWSCGSPCLMNAIIEASTGEVLHTFDSYMGVNYSLSSRLLEVNTGPEDRCWDLLCEYCEPEFFIWTEGRLQQLQPAAS